MKNISNGIRIIEGTTNFLIIAPHGPIINGKYENDIRTGVIAEEIHNQLGCFTIINDRFFKPKGQIKKDAQNFFLDLYRVDHSKKVPGYIDSIMSVANSNGKTFVLWLHGIFDDFAITRGKEHMDLGFFDGPAESLHALIAYGQGGDPKTGDEENRLTASEETIQFFQENLNSSGMNTLRTHSECNNYRGRDSKRFNQYFLNQGFGFDQIESIQLEIKEAGFRNTEENAIKTAKLISRVLNKMCLKIIEE